MSGVWGRRLVSMMGCAAVALALLAGCGGESPASKAFGGLSSADEKALPKWSEHFRDVPEANIEVVRTFSSGTIASASDAVDRYSAAVDRSTEEAKDFENADLRTAIDDYMRPFARLADAYRSAVAYFSAHPDAPQTDPEAQAVVADIQDAAAQTREADKKLLAQLTRVMSADQRKKFLDQVGKAQKQYEDEAKEAAGG